MKTGVVKEFKGEYAFLSNFYVNPFAWRGERYDTGEHAFQAAKRFFLNDSQPSNTAYWDIKIRNAETPAKAKYLGRSIPINVDEWNKNRVAYMREIVHVRFQTSDESMVGPLINTGAMMLVEGNDWGDTFWGRALDKSTGRMVGFNTLGVLLMEERGYWLKGNF